MSNLSTEHVRVAVRDEGLTLLYQPAEGKPVVNIIFVHGLKGHPRKTWVSKTQHATQGTSQQKRSFLGIGRSFLGIGRSSRPKPATDDEGEDDVMFWPLHLLPKDCPKASIWTFGYDSCVSHFFSGPANQNNVFGHAKNLLYELNRVIDDRAGQKIIFVAHSLGGIVVKEVGLPTKLPRRLRSNTDDFKVLRRSEGADDTEIRNLLRATHALVFLGTPHRGTGYAPIGEVVRRVVSALGFDTNDKQIRALQFDSIELELSREEFARQWRKDYFLVRTFQEGQGMKATNFKRLNEKVVPDMSSSLDDTRERAQHINKNHEEMCRFSGPDDPGYRQVGGELKDLVEDIDRQLEEQNRQKLRQAEEVTTKKPLTAEDKGCLRSVHFSQIDSRYHDVREPTEGTCGWLFERQEYRQWLNKTQGSLWLKGKAGSAKSTLMKRAVEDFGDQKGAPGTLMVKHFFNARGVALEKNFLGLMRSLLYQLLLQDRPVLEQFLPRFRKKQETHRADWEWHADELREFMLSIPSPMCFYIDALDECNESERQDVVSFLERLMQHARSNDVLLKIFFSSRHFPDIDIGGCDEIHPEKYNGTDISTYAAQRLSRLPDQKGALKLKKEIIGKAQGVFLWVVLVIGILTAIKYESVEVKRRRLREIPPELSQLYGNILEGMDSEERKGMYLMIQWVIFAREPLTPEELLTAMAFDLEHNYPSLEKWQKSESYIDERSQIDGLIRVRSRGMIEVKQRRRSPPNQHQPSGEENPSSEEQADWSNQTDLSAVEEGPLEDGREQKTSIVQFIHESAREFFLHNKDDALTLLAPASCENFVGSSHDRLARACINYLGIQELRVWYMEQKSTLDLCMREGGNHSESNLYESALRSIKTPHLPFAPYATSYIFAHAECAESNEIKQTHLVDLFGRYQGDVFQTWALLHDKTFERRFTMRQGPRASLLYAASVNNVSSCVESLLDSGINSNTNCGGNHRFPLVAEAHNDDGQTALCYAIMYGNMELVSLLLNRGANIEAHDNKGQTALHMDREKEVVPLLLNRGANIKAHDNGGQTALHFAVIHGRIEAISLLLNRSANIEAHDNKGQTALHFAVMHGPREAISLLLTRGAIIEALNNQGQTALHFAVMHGRMEVISLLLTRGVNIEAHDNKGQTVLHFAVMYGRMEAISLLLDRGANIETHDNRGQTALHFAVMHWRMEVVRLLLTRGVNIEAHDNKGQTVLHFAAILGLIKVISLLLDRGVNIEAHDNKGKTALHFAVIHREMEVIPLLLDRGVNIKAHDNEGKTALHHAVIHWRMEVIPLLLDRGANIEAHDNKGQTALQIGMKRKNEWMGSKWRGWKERVGALEAIIHDLETHAKTKQSPPPFRPTPQAPQD